jgi:hypothetical protein
LIELIAKQKRRRNQQSDGNKNSDAAVLAARPPHSGGWRVAAIQGHALVFQALLLAPRDAVTVYRWRWF